MSWRSAGGLLLPVLKGFAATVQLKASMHADSIEAFDGHLGVALQCWDHFLQHIIRCRTPSLVWFIFHVRLGCVC